MPAFFSLTDLGLAGSSSQLLADYVEQMQLAFPGYSPSASNLEYVQATIFSSMAADLATLCGEGATELFRTYATTLVGVPYQDGISAQAVITVTPQSSPTVIATTSADLSIVGAVLTISVNALEFGIAAGNVTLSDPTLGHTQTFVTTGANAGDTTISVTSAVPNFAYPVGSTFSGVQQYEIPALAAFSLDDLGFASLAAITINAGVPTNVTVTAVQTGTIFNGAGSGGNVQSVQQLSWVTSLSVSTVASGGADPEDDTHYLDRVTTTLQLQAPRPITAADYGTMAVNFTPYPGTDQQDVGRATSIDGYNPADGSLNNVRMVAVAVTDSNGFALNNDTLYGYPNGTSSNIIATAPNPATGWGLAGWLGSLREINFVVNVINPTYSLVYVTVTVKAGAGWDTTSVKTNVQSALLSYLAPQSWGLPRGNPSDWLNSTTIYQSTLASTIQNIPGVDHVASGTLKFGLSPGPGNIADLLLPGAVALPTSNTTTIPTSAITVT